MTKALPERDITIDAPFGGVLFGGGGNDTLTGSSCNDSLYGEGGNDSIWGETGGNDYADGGDGNDTIMVWGAGDTLVGGAGADSLRGVDGGQHYIGGSGNDTLDAWANGLGSTLDGGLGDDLYRNVRPGDVLIDDPGGIDTIEVRGNRTLAPGIEHLILLNGARGEGNESANRITGWAGSSTILGAGGADTLRGLGGEDLLDGGTGEDMAIFAGTLALYRGATQNGATLLYGPDGADTLISIESLQFDDARVAPSGVSSTNVRLGDAGNNTIAGEAVDELIDGLAGDDSLAGMEGADSLYGGLGADWLDGDAGGDSLTGGAGADTLLGGAGDDTLLGGSGDDLFDGGVGEDRAVLTGARSTYTLTRLPDGVQLSSIEGTDTFRGVETFVFHDTILSATALTGDIPMSATNNADTLPGTAIGEFIDGLGGNDVITGLGGADTLRGGRGLDSLTGGDGDDLIFGSRAAPLVINGSFELYGAFTDPEGTGRYLETADLTGWTLSNSPAAQLVRDGSEGARWLDTDTNNDNLRITQAIQGMEAGRRYELAFDIYTYGGVSGVEVFFGGVSLNRFAAAGPGWETVRLTVTGGSGDGSNRLAFGAGPGTGLDNVRFFDRTAEADTLVGGAGNDTLDGGSGEDVAVLGGPATAFQLVRQGNDLRVVDLRPGAPQGSDLLREIETLRFTDGEIAVASIADSGAQAGTATWRYGFGETGTSFTAFDTHLVPASHPLGFFDEWNNRAGASVAHNPGTATIVLFGGGTVLFPGTIQLHPGPGDAADAIVQWSAAAAGLYHVSGYFAVWSTTVGSQRALVFRNGENLSALAFNGGDGVLNAPAATTTAPGETFTFSMTLALAMGDVLSFGVDWDGGYGSEATGLNVAIAPLIPAAAPGAGPDSLVGTPGADTIDGLAGNDTIDGLDGNDSLLGGADADSIAGGAGSDTLLGAGGDDRIDTGGFGTFTNTQHGDWAYGGTGNDTLIGGDNSDNLFGEDGDDSLVGGTHHDGVYGGAGNDTIAMGDNLPAFDTQVGELGDGGAGNDSLSGAGGWQVLRGDSGADTLSGGAGNDALDGGADADVALYTGNRAEYDITTIAGGVQVVHARGSMADGTDSVLNVESFRFADGSFTQAALFGPPRVIGDDNPNTIAGSAAAEVIEGRGGADSLSGLGGADTLLGEAGNDTLQGGLDADSMAGGPDNDLYFVDDPGDVVLELANQGTADTVRATRSYTLASNVERLILNGGAAIDGTGNQAANILTGNGAANALAGLGANDTLRGQEGADTLTGGAGNDSLDGGDGNDIAIFTGNRADYDVVTLAGAEFRLTHARGSQADGVDLVIGVESFRFADGTIARDNLIRPAGTPGADTLLGGAVADTLAGLGGDDLLRGMDGEDLLQGQAGADTLDGGAGDDTLDGGAGFDLADYAGAGSGVVVDLDLGEAMDGGGGFDALSGIEAVRGSSFEDWLRGGMGDETFLLSAGADTIDGGEGFDTLSLASSAAPVFVDLEAGIALGGMEIAGIEALIGSGFADILLGDGQANRLQGGAGNDVLSGGAGNDTLEGGAGNDTMSGGAGSDTYLVEQAGDVVIERSGGGTDTVLTMLASLTLVTQVEALVFVGTGAFAGTGNAASNRLTGGLGADTLSGMGGNDVLRGGGGNDRLVGGAGTDRFVLDQASLGASVTITDLDRALRERIDLSLIDAIAATPEDDAFAFIGTAAFGGVAGQLRWSDLGATRRIEGDVNGDSAADITVLVTAAGPVAANWFLL
jgi:Ca2+-binding RTX toxin-like protein